MFAQKNNHKEQSSQASFPIGVFDSGIGGLSVANAIAALLPHESLCYYGDTAHLPYGTKPLSTIQTYSHNIAQFLIEQHQVKAIVVACNTASAAAIEYLRATWPDMPFIGMEPAVKPGVSQTQSGKVGVLATQGTFSSDRYNNLTQRFAQEVEVLENPCIGLVELIEDDKTEDAATTKLLENILRPMLDAGVDTFVLGCTHYPFAEAAIRDIIGTDKRIINPAPAVARQLKKVLERKELLTPPRASFPQHQFFTSGNKVAFNAAVNRFFFSSKVSI